METAKDRGRRGRHALGLALAAGFVVLCGLPYWRWSAHPSLFDDDFLRVGSLRRSTLGEALFRPFNEHMAPLFETVSWLAWRGAGRRVLALPMAFQVASFLAFGVTVGLLWAVIGRELRSRTTSLVAVALFCLSSVSSETVLWYSASSFQWAASATLASWLAASLATASPNDRGRAGWLAASAFGALAAPAFSAIGILAGPLAATRIVASVDRPLSRGRRIGLSILPVLGSVAYLLACDQFRYRELVSESVGRNFHLGAALWATVRAPTAVLIPSVLGLPDLSARIPGGVLAVATLAGLVGSLAWAIRSRDRPLILGGLAFIAGGYLATYATRARPGDTWIFLIGRYHLFPQIGLIFLIAASASRSLGRFDSRPIGRLLLACSVAILLSIVQYPRMFEASDRTFRYPDQPRALASALRLEQACDREGITIDQAIRVLDPIRTPWFPRPWPCNPLLNLFGTGPTTAKIPDHLVLPTLIAALSPEDLEAIFGGMEATRYLAPSGSPDGPKPAVESRLVESSRIKSVGQGGYRIEGPPCHLEYELGPEADDASALSLPGLRVSRPLEIWWTDEGGEWTPYRSVRWNPGPGTPSEGWAVALDHLPHWRRGKVRRLRVVIRQWGTVAIGPPRMLR